MVVELLHGRATDALMIALNGAALEGFGIFFDGFAKRE